MLVFHEPLWVCAMGFGTVSLRYAPFDKFLCKSLAEWIRAAWYPCYLLGIGLFLVRELANFPDPSARLPHSFRVSLPYWVNVPAHAAVWLDYVMTAYHLHQFRNVRHIAEEVVDFTFDILLLPITFGLLALHCIRILPDREGRDLWGATSTLDAAELWESWALWSFQALFIRYVEGSEDAEGRLFAPFRQVCLVGVLQYVAFNFVSNILEFSWREVDHSAPQLCDRLWGEETDCEQVFHKLQDYSIGALWYSCSIAIYSILQFEQAMSRSLKPIGPFWKFWGAKLIVSVAGIQRLVLFGFTALGIVSEVFAWYVHAYLLCFETLLLSLLHFWAYPASGYFKIGGASGRAPKIPRSEGRPAPVTYGRLSEASALNGVVEEITAEEALDGTDLVVHVAAAGSATVAALGTDAPGRAPADRPIIPRLSLPPRGTTPRSPVSKHDEASSAQPRVFGAAGLSGRMPPTTTSDDESNGDGLTTASSRARCSDGSEIMC